MQRKFDLPGSLQTDIEEALGVLWHRFEEDVHAKSELVNILAGGVSPNIYDRLLEHKLIRENGINLVFTPEGEKCAKDVTRRHRLAERLLSDVLSLGGDCVDQNACRLEHIISQEVVESICTLLGHPKQCPHGMPIPSGDCCDKAVKTVESLVVPLSRMEAGTDGRLAYVASKDHPEIHKLLSFGVVPGTMMHIHQTWPTYVVQVDETQLAFEKAIADHIYIRKLLTTD